MTHSVFSFRFNGYFPGESGSASFIGAMEVVVTAGDKMCNSPVKLSPPTNQHPTFYRPDALPVAHPTVSKH